MRNSIKKMAAVLAASTTLAAAAGQSAFAQFSSPSDQNFVGLLGDSTVGSETGVYELGPLIQSAGLAIVTLTIVMVGIVFARKTVRKFSG